MTLVQENPYCVGDPVIGEKFFGREDVLKKAENTFLSPGIKSVIVYGQRRIGKTSILLELKRRLSDRGTPTIFFDLMGMANEPFGKLLHRLARIIVRELKLSPRIAKMTFDDEGLVFQHEFLPKVLDTLTSPDQRIILLFDEFDVLDIVERDDLPETVAANRFFATLRQWMREEQRLIFGFALGRELSDLDTDFLATFKGGLTFRISVLSHEATARLIRSPTSIRYSDAAVDRIYTLTHGHPYFAQLLCYLLFNQTITEGDLLPGQTPTIQVEMIDGLLSTAFETADNVFHWIWNGLPPAEQILTSALAELLTAESESATRDDLLAALQTRRLRIVSSELQTAPDRLVAWQLLEEVENGYRFLVPVFQYWVRDSKPLSKVQLKLDQADPRAHRYYELGKLEFEQDNLSTAIQHLEHALRINPEHLQARIVLGHAYLEDGDIDTAVSSFEEAYKRDDVLAGPGLAQALLIRAEKTKEKDRALADYERVLQVMPANLEAAEKVREAKELERERAVKDLSKQVKKNVAKEEWAQAEKLYTQLLVLDPENTEQWQQGLLQAKRSYELANLYKTALSEIQAENWSAAIDSFTKITNIDVRYKDVLDLLAKAIAEEKREDELNREYQAAQEALATKEYDIAIEHLNHIVKSRRGYKDANKLLALAKDNARSKAISDGLQEIRSAISADDFDKAVKAAKKVLKLDKDNEEASQLHTQAVAGAQVQAVARGFRKAQSTFKAGEFGDAIDAAKGVLELEPDHHEAIELLKRAQSAAHEKNRADALQKAQETVEKQSLKEAISELNSILGDYPDHTEIRTLLNSAQRRRILNLLLIWSSRLLIFFVSTFIGVMIGDWVANSWGSNFPGDHGGILYTVALFVLTGSLLGHEMTHLSTLPKTIEKWKPSVWVFLGGGLLGIFTGIVNLLLAGGISWLIGWVVRLFTPTMLGFYIPAILWNIIVFLVFLSMFFWD